MNAMSYEAHARSEERDTSHVHAILAAALVLAVWVLTVLTPARAHAQVVERAREAGVLSERALRSAAIAAGYVSPEVSLEDDGAVLAAANEGSIPERSLTLFDFIHVDLEFDGRPATVGDTLLVYREEGDLENPASHRVLGRIVYPTGLAVVTSVGTDVASAVIVGAFDAVQIGQRVQFLKPRQSPLPVGEQSGGEGIVLGLRDRSAIQPPFAIIYLDLPPGSALRPGQEIALVRPAEVDGRELPEIDIGSARVLDVGEAAVTAVVVALERSDLRSGDRYRPLETGS
jgi:hypothetical protein